MKRREFIRTTAVTVPLIGLFPANLSEVKRKKVKGKIEKRMLGKTGEMLSVIGFGGIVVKDATTAEAAERVKMAIDAGINYFDVAPSYGNAEVMLGPALEPYRKGVFLACKTQKRSRDEAREELEQSLKNLRTDHFDLYQFHAVTTMEDVEKIHAPGGAMETYLQARKDGKIRFIGFSAHSVEAAMAMMDRFDFDTILFPFNYTTWNAGNFGPQVLARAQEKKMGILALKAMAKGPWPKNADRTKYPKCWYEPLTTTEDILMGLRFTLSHPITAAVPPGDENLFKLALSVKDRIKPLSQPEIDLIRQKALKGEPLFSYKG
ncbi:MAG TPA: aldo/keto reductase [Bacteroidales bacterium]|nr:aldo/keto reductase [Bacteroidales bacterium]HOX74261.1 aldo/keto reductase [Bacteroidales bacterium]